MKKLKFGQTPFDRMTKEELREASIRMFNALEATASCLKISKWNNEHSPYWGFNGAGGEALAKAEQVIDPIYKEYGSEAIYRTFYRYACNLIFKDVDPHYWKICDNDGVMLSPGNISCPQCKEKMRPLTLKDLREPKEYAE